MKRYIISIACIAFSMICSAQSIHIFHDGIKKPDVFANGGVNSIYFAPKFMGSEEYQLMFDTKDGKKSYNIIDSVKFNLPYLSAFQHTYYIPADFRNYIPNDYSGYFGFIKLAVSRSGGELSVRYSDDEPVSHFGGETLQYYADKSTKTQLRSITDSHYYLLREDDYSVGTNDKWYIHSNNMKDSITIIYSTSPMANNQFKDICFSNEEQEYVIDTSFPNPDILFINPNYGYSYYNDEGKPVIHLYKNESGEKRTIPIDLSIGGFPIMNYSVDQLGTPFKHTAEEHMAALREFCDSTDYENWGRYTNWWSDDPLWKWGGFDFNESIMYGSINATGLYFDDDKRYRYLIDDHIVSLNFGGGQYTGVKGTLPASFEVFMDDVQGQLSLFCCGLYGKIPYNIRHHEKWPEFGWEFIQQHWFHGRGLDMDSINLKIDNTRYENYIDNSTHTTLEKLKENKITWVFNAGAAGIFNGISDERVNKYLDYREKGLGLVITVRRGTDKNIVLNYIKEQQTTNNLPRSIEWANSFDKADIGPIGSMSILDNEGNLLWYKYYYFGIPESYYVELVDSVCRKYIGEPSLHEPYVSTYYKSTDYSHDGEVMTLQTATVGKGIDLVFMGDMYVDTLLVEGGKFEKDMYASMEYFFEVEPYKTLRDRFNVYAVKAVSPNGYDGPEHKFNDNKTVFDYAQKIPNVDMDNVAITILKYNPFPSAFLTGETNMWESGASIAWIEDGGPSSIICHETGGHGFAKLLDEYLYNTDNHVPEEEKEDFREWIKKTYHDKGWGMNVSATDNPEEVPWSRFMKDIRYKDEIGIYKGAWLYPEDLWRPSEKSVMNKDYTWFNAPSREAIYKRVMQLSEGEGWNYDYEKFVEFDAKNRDLNKHARARSQSEESQSEEKEIAILRRQVELRPPTIYKGSWRDADKCEKLAYPIKNPNAYKHNVSSPTIKCVKLGDKNVTYIVHSQW